MGALAALAPADPALAQPVAALAAWLATATPAEAAAAVGPVSPQAAAYPEEEVGLGRAVARRRDEFRTGRLLARAALRRLGCAPAPLPADAQGAPCWPAGFVGSISHGGGLCVAVVAPTRAVTAIGIDAEPRAPGALETIEAIASPAERAALHAAPVGAEDAATLCFSAKEAVFKAYFPRMRTFLEFHDAELAFDWDAGRFTATLATARVPALDGAGRIAGRFVLLPGYAATAIWIGA
jgi:4'-phosphopantetheinyl transferase EntD